MRFRFSKKTTRSILNRIHCRSMPYMLFVVPLNESRKIKQPDKYLDWSLYDKFDFSRSDPQAMTHIDCSARVHIASKNSNPKFWELINIFKQETG